MRAYNIFFGYTHTLTGEYVNMMHPSRQGKSRAMVFLGRTTPKVRKREQVGESGRKTSTERKVII